MNNLNRFLCLSTVAASMFLSACSDETSTENESAQSTKVEQSNVGNSKELKKRKSEDKAYYQEMSKPADKANWTEKGKFNKEFTRDCIARELRGAGSEEVDKKFVESTCDCIADYMDDHLTDQEAEEFLKEDSHMRALQIRYDTAAYHCIAGAKKVSEPKVTRFQ